MSKGMKCVVCNNSGGGVFVEEKVGKETKVVKKLPGDVVTLDDDVATDLLDKAIVKPFAGEKPAEDPAA